MVEELRSRIAAIVRQDLAEEAAAGFPLLKRFPNSETASVPGYFAEVGAADRETLLDALAYYSTLQWSHEIVREKKAHPVLGPYLARRPLYPDGDWYGARPKKSVLKKTVTERLTQAGFARIKLQPPAQSDYVEFSLPESVGRLIISFNPGLMRQMDFGIRDWLRPDLAKDFALPSPRDFIPLMGWLAYDHLWDGRGVNNPVCWDVISERDLTETGSLLVEIVNRLFALAVRINALAD